MILNSLPEFRNDVVMVSANQRLNISFEGKKINEMDSLIGKNMFLGF